ncbi:hypothetical protein BU16DRAFT_489544 [Lophium mytilinum]|uniref:Zn(2)-C6 fungal-type domain-containing protein n=1 Tax=Lophium mytilinum TaxID=390894 RepID=A0A6A6QLX1_9PEZI|nr:hypothetical protein BU16DRAFT_489544 [Lophium mytilinum]
MMIQRRTKEGEKYQRLPRACESCRLRKIKCNGANPCRGCLNHNEACQYRVKPRNRRTKDELASPIRHTTTSQPNLPNASSQIDPLQSREAIQSVSATDHVSPMGTIQLYYGPSSNFSFLQHIYRSLVCPSSRKNHISPEVQEGGPGLDFFQQRQSYFALAPEYPPYDMNISFLTLDCAKRLVQSYATTLGHLVPIWSEAELLCRLTALYCQLQRNDGSFSPDKTILLCILAIGAATAEMLDWAEILYIRAKSECIMFEDVMNLQAVQIPLLMAQYQTNMGRSNSSYIYLGTAARKALAIGLHRGIGAHDDGSDSSLVQETRTTLWSLYFFETQVYWTSFGLGRICSLDADDISCPYPDNQEFLASICQLSAIMSRCSKNLYSKRQNTLKQMWKAASTINDELRVFATKVGIGTTDQSRTSTPSESQSVQRFLLNNLYYQTVILTFRPFLIVWAANQQANMGGDSGGDYPITPLSVEQKWLREARRNVVDAAQDLIAHLAHAHTELPVVKKFRYHAFYVEFACCLLLYTYIWEERLLYTDYIKTGLACLRAMQPGEPVTSSIVCIERMRQIVQQSSDSVSVVTGGEQPCSAQTLDTTNPFAFPTGPPTSNDPSRDFMSLWQPELISSRPSTDFGSMSWIFDVAASSPSSIFPIDMLD